MSSTSAPTQLWSGSGIIESFIDIPESSKLSQETLEKWFDEQYVPSLLATGIVESVWRFKAASPTYSRQNVAFYRVVDLAAVQAGKLKSVPRTSKLFPTDGPVDDFVELESRTYSFVQRYETTERSQDAATTIIYAAMQPTSEGEADLDKWYREEHNQQMSQQPGWVRTTRWSLLAQQRNDFKQPGGLSFLAVHEFGDGHDIGTEVKPLDPMSDWTKKCMSEAKAIEAAVFNKVKTYGKAAQGS